MSFLPEDEIRGNKQVNLAPMIDFLFLMVVFFASMAVSRIVARDTDIDLVKVEPQSESRATHPTEDTTIIHIAIDKEGAYKWVTEIQDYAMDTAEAIQRELVMQHRKGVLPEDKGRTKVLLKIDKEAQWDPVMKAVFAIRDAGFQARPMYEPTTTEQQKV
jgi:biopolymer transport protein ExbD